MSATVLKSFYHTGRVLQSSPRCHRLFFSLLLVTSLALFTQAFSPIRRQHAFRVPQWSAVPRHIGFICDGNSRWAQARGFPASVGHTRGAEQLMELLKVLQTKGVLYCTLYGFSTENWKRPAAEVGDILKIMEQTAKRFYKSNSGVRVKVLGDLDDTRIPVGLRETLRRIEQESQDEELTVCLAINYGGRHDIVQACQRILQDNRENVDETVLASYLSTAGIPDPDLIVRTGGERRLSNFLLWNAAYTEIYFTDTLWPDFDQASLDDALAWYSQRKRRFGGRVESPAPSA